MIDICSPVSTNETLCFSPGLRKTRLTPARDLIGTGTVSGHIRHVQLDDLVTGLVANILNLSGYRQSFPL